MQLRPQKKPLARAACRRAGQVRAQTLTFAQRQKGGFKRAAQQDFIQHNQAIAGEGFWSQSATLRAPSNRLLDHTQIEFLRPEAFRYCLLQDGTQHRFSQQEQRLVFGTHVWFLIWRSVEWAAPPMADDAAYLAESDRVRAILGRGESLPTPLDALFITPNDFCDDAGQLLRPENQRKFFRAALRKAHQAALAHAKEILQADRSLRPVQPAPVAVSLWEDLDEQAFRAQFPGRSFLLPSYGEQ